MINAWENNTKVRTPTGHIGRTRATRRERILMHNGKLFETRVHCPDGITRTFAIEDLEEVIEEASEDEL